MYNDETYLVLRQSDIELCIDQGKLDVNQLQDFLILLNTVRETRAELNLPAFDCEVVDKTPLQENKML